MPPFNKNSSYGPLTALLVYVTRLIFHFCPPSFLVLMPSVAVKYAYRTATFATLPSVLIFLTWFNSSGLEDVTAAVTAIYLSRFLPPRYVSDLRCRRQLACCDLSYCVVAWCVRAKQHSSSFSALGGGHEPLASRGQPVPPQSVGLRARQAGQLPAVTL